MICQLCVRNIEINILLKLGIRLLLVLLDIKLVIVIYSFFVISLGVIVNMIINIGFEVFVENIDRELDIDIIEICV